MGVEVYTDGACMPNPGQGAWGFLIKHSDGREITGGGYERRTTNNRMEFKAFIEATKMINKEEPVQVFSDSNLLVQTYNLWMDGWGKTLKKKKNQDLVLELMRIKREFPKLRLSWVKGHAGLYGNERADELCGFFLENNWIGDRSYLETKQVLECQQ